MKNKSIIIGAIIIAVIGSVIFWKFQLKDKLTGTDNNKTETAQETPSINGVPVTKEVSETRPIAVVIENHIAARPQSGLSSADIVYETLAEGGITRFLAIYQTQHPKEIGPVRSARPYFNTLANQWGAVFAHVGGSTIALSELDAGVHKNLQDLNQYFFGDYFYRSKDRVAPHNAYTTVELLRDLMTKKNWTKWNQPHTLGQFKTIPTSELKTEVTKISARFSSDANYTSTFEFDPNTGLYNRLNNGKPALDKNTGVPVTPRNVLVQFVDDYVVPMDPAPGVGLNLDRDGRAILFTGGTAREGTWRYKNGIAEYITTNDQGQSEPLKFQPGQTWIILMPKTLTNNVTWK